MTWPFCRGAANILGMAIERERHERSLKAALSRQQVLLKEVTHRVNPTFPTGPLILEFCRKNGSRIKGR